MINYKPLALYYAYIWNGLHLQRKFFLNFQFIKIFLYKWDIPNAVNTKLLFTQSMNRNDYNEFVKLIYGEINCNEKEYILIAKKNGLNVDFLELNFRDYLSIWSDIDIIAKNMFMKLYIFINIIQVASIRKKLKKYSIDILTTHADMQPVENYLIQFFKINKVTTITLQHGLYVDYSKNININEVNYKNVVSDFFLAWGEETKELITKYHQNCNVIICGNPIIKPIVKKNTNYFSVVFDNELFKKYNKEILKIAQKLAKEINMKIVIRLHPGNNIKDYDIDKRLVTNENIEGSMFVIGHTTTMIYTLMRAGVTVFKYRTSFPSNKVSQEISFSNLLGLKNKVENKRNQMKFGEYFIKYIDVNSLLKYKSFYNELIDKTGVSK